MGSFIICQRQFPWQEESSHLYFRIGEIVATMGNTRMLLPYQTRTHTYVRTQQYRWMTLKYICLLIMFGLCVCIYYVIRENVGSKWEERIFDHISDFDHARKKTIHHPHSDLKSGSPFVVLKSFVFFVL
jgi:hypothetical protein